MTKKKTQYKKRSASRRSIKSGAKVQEKKAATNMLAEGWVVHGATGVSNVDAQGVLKKYIPTGLSVETIPSGAAPALIRKALEQAAAAGGDSHDVRFAYVHIYRAATKYDLVCIKGKSDLLTMTKTGHFVGIEVKDTSVPTQAMRDINVPVYFEKDDIFVLPLHYMRG